MFNHIEFYTDHFKCYFLQLALSSFDSALNRSHGLQ